MSGQCSSIAQRCREVREEVFKHLTAFTAIEISLAQIYFPVVIAFAGSCIAVAAAFMTTAASMLMSTHSNTSSSACSGTRLDTNIYLAIAAAVLFAIAAAMIIIAYYQYEKKRGKAMKIAGETTAVHLEDIARYIDMLEDCCGELRRSGCASEEPLYCGDLNRLQRVKCKAQDLLEEGRKELTQLY